MDPLQLLGLALASISVLIPAGKYIQTKLEDKGYLTKKFSWKDVEKAIKKVGKEMKTKNYEPTLIVGIGRGGAVLASLLSGFFGYKPIIVVDIKDPIYGGRQLPNIRISKEILQKVLLVSGETHTGKTLSKYHKYLKDLGSKDIKIYTFYLEERKLTTKDITINYVSYTGTYENVKFPWMITKNYIRREGLRQIIHVK